jgi:TRAP-type C4-dicarboxylate transport system substrate-binding protein
VCILFAYGALSVPSASAHGVPLKVQHALPADSPFHTQFLVPWAHKLEQESGGRLHFQLYPAMQMGGEPAQLFDQAKNGDAEIVWAALTDDDRDRFPALQVFALPFMSNSTEGSSRALWEYVRMSDLAHMEFDGVRVLAIHQSDAPQFHLRDRSIKSLADLNGLKLGVPSRMGAKVLAALGAAPVEMPPARVGAALSRGELDGALLPWEAVPALKLEDAVKYHSEIEPKSPRLYASVYVLAMNAAAYKSLPDDLKKVVLANSGAETSAWLGKVFDDGAASARKLAAARGDAINVLPAEELAKWKTPAQRVIDQWMQELDQRGVQGKELIDSARETLAEYDRPR